MGNSFSNNYFYFFNIKVKISRTFIERKLYIISTSLILISCSLQLQILTLQKTFNTTYLFQKFLEFLKQVAGFFCSTSPTYYTFLLMRSPREKSLQQAQFATFPRSLSPQVHRTITPLNEVIDFISRPQKPTDTKPVPL